MQISWPHLKTGRICNPMGGEVKGCSHCGKSSTNELGKFPWTLVVVVGLDFTQM